ncbi:MAG: Ig-like domain-containing protein [Saprospiraceae bacterium]|nr:Ig-like domain-containing protein [Saprospiraceae bacterium]
MMLKKWLLAQVVVLIGAFLPTNLLAQDPCDDDDVVTGSISYNGPFCSGAAIFLTFTLTPEDDSDGIFDVVYSFGGQEFTLLDVSTGHVVSHVVNFSTTAVLLTILNDDANCINTINQSLVIDVLPAPGIIVSNTTQPACGQNNGGFTAQGTGGASPYQYSLDGVNFQSSGTFSNLGAGNYTVTVRDANGCTGQQGVALNSSSNLTLNLVESNGPECQKDNGNIRVSAQGGQPSYSFSIDGVNYQASALFGDLGPGSYVIYCLDAQGCLSTLEVTLEDPAEGLIAAQASVGSAEVCPETPFQLTGNLPAGTTGSWTATGGNVLFTAPGSPSSLVSIDLPGTYTLTWTLSTPDCTEYSSASLMVTVMAPPVAQSDGPVVVSGSGGGIPVLNNDAYAPGITLTLVQQPSQGIAAIDAENRILYTPNGNAVGFDTLVYQICQEDCDFLCDTAMVIFSNESEICDLNAAPENVFPEGITPNGDGYNEQL